MARAASKLTVREIEQATGVNKDSVSRYEAGRDILASALQKLEKLFLEAGIIFLDETRPAALVSDCPRQRSLGQPQRRGLEKTKFGKRSQKAE